MKTIEGEFVFKVALVARAASVEAGGDDPERQSTMQLSGSRLHRLILFAPLFPGRGNPITLRYGLALFACSCIIVFFF